MELVVKYKHLIPHRKQDLSTIFMFYQSYVGKQMTNLLSACTCLIRLPGSSNLFNSWIGDFQGLKAEQQNEGTNAGYICDMPF